MDSDNYRFKVILATIGFMLFVLGITAFMNDRSSQRKHEEAMRTPCPPCEKQQCQN